MKKLILLTSVVLLMLFCEIAYSQNVKTPYEKKREALKGRLFIDLGLPVSLINSTSNVSEFFDMLIYKMQTEKGMSLVVQYQQDLKKAESLKNATDLKKEPLHNTNSEIWISAPIHDGPKQEQVKDDNTVYSFVSMENPPSYPGGMEKFYKFLNDNIKYPEVAKENNIQGNVFVSFTVEKDGSLTELRVDRKLGYGTDEEAVRVLKLSKRWNPGIKNGKPVRVKYNIPIRFSPKQ